MGVNPGGGGGPAGVSTSDLLTLDMPGELSGFTDADLQRLNDMLRQLYLASQRVSTVAQAGVAGPTTAVVAGDVVLFDGTTGAKIKDSSIVGANLVTGPASAVSGNLPTFADTTGKLLQDSGSSIASLQSPLKWVKISLNNAAILTAHSVPITAVAAAGAGLTIVPALWYMREDSSAGAYSANPTFNVQYHGNNTALLTGITPNLNSGDKRWSSGGLSGWGPVTFNPENVAVEIVATADVSGGNAANTILIMLGYLVSQ